MNAYPVRPSLAGLAPQNGRVFSWDLPFPLPPDVAAWIEFAAIATLALLGLAGLLFALRKAWRAAKKASTEDILTVVAASIATGVSAQGMWQFAGDVLGFDGPLRLLLFAFIEVAVITSAVRARRNMRENYAAGIDGLAVWVLTCLSAVLSAMDAASVAEAIFRLAAPLVAAWLWERGMAIERVRLTGRRRIHWRITPERVLVRLGLAEPSERTAGEVDANRRLTRVALAADRAASAKPGGKWQRLRLAILKRRGRQMIAHTAVSGDETQQTFLLNQLGVAKAIGELAEAAPAPFWKKAAEPGIEAAPTVPDLGERPVGPAEPPVEPKRTKRQVGMKWRIGESADVSGREVAAAAYRVALRKGVRLSYADLAGIARISTRQAGYAVSDVLREEEEAAERERVEALQSKALAESDDPAHGSGLADPVEFSPVPEQPSGRVLVANGSARSAGLGGAS